MLMGLPSDFMPAIDSMPAISPPPTPPMDLSVPEASAFAASATPPATHLPLNFAPAPAVHDPHVHQALLSQLMYHQQWHQYYEQQTHLHHSHAVHQYYQQLHLHQYHAALAHNAQCQAAAAIGAVPLDGSGYTAKTTNKDDTSKRSRGIKKKGFSWLTLLGPDGRTDRQRGRKVQENGKSPREHKEFTWKHL